MLLKVANTTQKITLNISTCTQFDHGKKIETYQEVNQNCTTANDRAVAVFNLYIIYKICFDILTVFLTANYSEEQSLYVQCLTGNRISASSLLFVTYCGST